MAVVFELVVNFGENETAVADAEAICGSVPPVCVRGIDVSLTGPHIAHFAQSYIEFSVGLYGVSRGYKVHPQFKVTDLTNDDMSEFRDHLYGLLRQFDGFVAAIVGWDPEEVVDLPLLRDRVDEYGLDRLDGLVLASDIVVDWGLVAEFSDFAPGYSWLPSGPRSGV